MPADADYLAVFAPDRYAVSNGVRGGQNDSDASACPGQCDKGYTTAKGATSAGKCFLAHRLVEVAESGSNDASRVGWCGGADKATSSLVGADADDCDFDNRGYAYVAGPIVLFHPAAAAWLP